MKAGPNVKAQWSECIAQRQGAPDCPPRAIEYREHPVAGHLDDLASMLLDNGSSYDIVAFKQVAPGPIAKRGRSLRGTDYVGEEDGC
jgi:hypothetical protein